MIYLAPVDVMGLTHVCRNLRDADRRELMATTWTNSPDDIAMSHMQLGEFSWIAWDEDEPVAAIGAAPRWPGVWSVWAFGTDKFKRAGLTLTRHVRRVIIPTLYSRGAHRADAYSLGDHTEAHRWLVSLGARAEARIPGYGKGGEEFVLFSWDRKAVERICGATGDRRPEPKS